MDIALFVTDFSADTVTLTIRGVARLAGITGDNFGWEAIVNFDASPAVINQACKDAAIAAAADMGHTVLPLDNKLLFAAAALV